MGRTNEPMEVLQGKHVTWLKYAGILFVIIGTIATVFGFTQYDFFSSVQIYVGITFITCGIFLLLAAYSITKTPMMSGNDTHTSLNSYRRVQTIAGNTGLSSIDNERLLTETVLRDIRYFLTLANDSGNCLIIKIHPNGLTSLDVVLPIALNLNPSRMTSRALKCVQVDRQFLAMSETKKAFLQSILAYLQVICEYNQYQSGRAYVAPNGTLYISIWPTKIHCGEPPNYYDVTDNEGLPSYADVTMIAMEKSTLSMPTPV